MAAEGSARLYLRQDVNAVSKIISDNAAAEQVAEPDFLIAPLLKSRLALVFGAFLETLTCSQP